MGVWLQLPSIHEIVPKFRENSISDQENYVELEAKKFRDFQT